MARWLLITLALASLVGCANHIDSAGNVEAYPLTPSQAAQVAQTVVDELGEHYPARTQFSFPHDPGPPLSAALEQSFRAQGWGITTESMVGFHRLGYRVQPLNAHQLFVLITVNQRQFHSIWSEEDGMLSRLGTVTHYEVNHE